MQQWKELNATARWSTCENSEAFARDNAKVVN
jgi:hypothetical protein